MAKKFKITNSREEAEELQAIELRANGGRSPGSVFNPATGKYENTGQWNPATGLWEPIPGVEWVPGVEEINPIYESEDGTEFAVEVEADYSNHPYLPQSMQDKWNAARNSASDGLNGPPNWVLMKKANK